MVIDSYGKLVYKKQAQLAAHMVAKLMVAMEQRLTADAKQYMASKSYIITQLYRTLH